MKIPIDCQRALEQLQDWLRDEMAPAAATELEAHLQKCAHCRTQAEFEARFRDVVARATSGGECPPETRARLLDALRREQQG